MNENFKTVYVLGLDYQVKDEILWSDAVTHILKGTMSPFKVHETKRVRSAGGNINMAWPLIVRLNYWVDVPRQAPVDMNTRATRHEILRRDGHTCCYCGGKAATVDHIIPESRCKKEKYPHNGWTWGNLAACCIDCNQTKANRTPEEAGMKLLWSPHTNVSRFGGIQAEVWRILETGDGYALEDIHHIEGILNKPAYKWVK